MVLPPGVETGGQEQDEREVSGCEVVGSVQPGGSSGQEGAGDKGSPTEHNSCRETIFSFTL